MRDARVGEEDLVELGVAGHLAQRPHFHTRLVHVEQEVGDASMLRLVGIGAREQHPVVGQVRVGRPHLLPVHHPLVAVTFRSRRQPGEVGARSGFAEELAPLVVGPGHRRQELLLLRIRAVDEDRGRDHAHPDARDRTPRHRVAHHLLVEDRLLARRTVTPAVLGGPGDGGEPPVGQLALPGVRVARSNGGGRVIGEPGLSLGTERAVLGALFGDLVGYDSHGSV